jgi:hypothetical protein
MDYLLEKRARAFVLRMVEEILRRVDFDDLSVVHELTRSATRRANPISWETTSMVMPSGIRRLLG